MTMTTTTAERVHKVGDIAEHLGVAPGAIYSLIASGRLRAIRVGRLLRVPNSALADFIANDTAGQ